MTSTKSGTARRRSSTFGTARKLPSGRWQARYLDPSGTRRTAPGTFDTKIAAEDWLAERRTEVRGGKWTNPDAGAESFGAYAARWLAERRTKSGPLKPRTRAGYQDILDRFLLPTFGAQRLDAISTAAVKGWHRRLDVGPTMAAHAYGLLRTILATAVADEAISRNPAQIRGAGSAKRASQTEPATLPELAIIVEAMPARLRMMVQLATWTALRFGELAELRREDVDTERGTLNVRRGVVSVKRDESDETRTDGRVIGTPKSDAGKRKLAIPPHLIDDLAAHLDEHAQPGPHGLLFPSVNGRHLATRTLYDAYHPAREAAGRPDLRFHDLRHTGLTLAAVTGATLAELMQLAGHSTPAAAMRYQHATDERAQIIAGRLSELATGTVVPIDRARRRTS
jgi:integrase